MQPIAITSIGIYVISSIIAIILIVLLFLRKLKPKLENKCKKSLLWTVPFICLILLSIGLIGAAIGTKNEMVEKENGDDIIRESLPIIINARKKLDAVDISNLILTDLIQALINYLEKFEQETGYKDCDTIHFHLTNVLQSGVHELSTNISPWLQTLTYGGCSVSASWITDSDSAEAPIWPFQSPFDDFYNSQVSPMSGSMGQISTSFANQASAQANSEFANNELNNRLSMRKSVLSNFESDVNNTIITRKKWVETMIISLPDKQLIAKIVIIITCSILIILSIISILLNVLERPLLRKSILIHTSGFFTIVVCVISIILSLDVLEKCSLNSSNFGLKDFLTSNESYQICQTKNSSAFDNLPGGTSLTADEFEKGYKYQELKESFGQQIVTSFKVLKFDNEYNVKRRNLKEKFEKLQKLYAAKCYNSDDQIKLQKYVDMVANVLVEVKRFEDAINRWNQFAANPNQTLNNLFDQCYSEMTAKMLKNQIDPMQAEINAADFSCDPIIEKYAKVGHSICDQVNVSIDIFLIYLVITIISFLCYLIINVLIYLNIGEHPTNV